MEASEQEMKSVEQLQSQLEAARAELQEFTYTVSHDLRAPLRHITAFAQVIAEDWPDMPADMAGHLATIRQSAQLLARQIDGLTQLSRLGQQSLSLQTVDVGAVAQEVALEVAARYPQQRVQWQMPANWPQVTADAALLRQLLVNLMDNAVKFSAGREPAVVSLTWHRLSDARCQISVQDHGMGIESAQAKALFKVFGRLQAAQHLPGLGLGLVVSRKILERLDGTISVDGTPGLGCCVTVTLPILLRST
jgi:light-regulated signal transduction histidine kinase (bacteriophytochrome)